MGWWIKFFPKYISQIIPFRYQFYSSWGTCWFSGIFWKTFTFHSINTFWKSNFFPQFSAFPWIYIDFQPLFWNPWIISIDNLKMLRFFLKKSNICWYHYVMYLMCLYRCHYVCVLGDCCFVFIIILYYVLYFIFDS